MVNRAAIPDDARAPRGGGVQAVLASGPQVDRLRAGSARVTTIPAWPLRASVKKLDRVSRRIFNDHLSTADTFDDPAAEGHPGLPEGCDCAIEVRQLHHESIPSPGLRARPVGHRLATSTLAAWCTEHQPQVAAVEHREGGCGMHLLEEAQMVAVEVDSSIDVGDDVANADCGHDACPFRRMKTLRPERYRAQRSRSTGQASQRPPRGYLRLLLRHRPGQAVVEVSDGTLSIAAAQPLAVALYRTAAGLRHR